MQTNDHFSNIEEFRPSLWTFAAERLLIRSEADDAVQEAIVIAFNARERLGADASEEVFLDWISNILQGVCDGKRKAQRRRARQEVSLETMTLAGYDPVQIYDYLPAELRHEIKYRLATTPLTKRQRECVEGRMAGESPDETALRLGIDRTTASKHFCQAIERLRRSPMGRDIVSQEAQEIFDDCANATFYRVPATVGTHITREKIKKLD